MQATKISNQALIWNYHPHHALKYSSLYPGAAAKMYAVLLEPDVCGEGSEAKFGIDLVIEPKCDSAIWDKKFEMHLVSLAH